MKILVTGGAGFIGSWLAEELLVHNHQLVVVDNLSAQIHGAIPRLDLSWVAHPNVEFVRADVRDRHVLDACLAKVDAVVHLAAETGTGQSMYQIAHYYDVNQQATAMLFELIGTCHKHVKRVVLASSRSIYGEGAYRLRDQVVVPAPRSAEAMKTGDFDVYGPNGETLELIATPESATAQPASVYAATKLANETLGRVFADAYGTAVVALRFQNVFGERQSLKNPYTGILSIFSNRMRKNLPINIFEDGQESRDFVHVSDIVRSVRLALEQEMRGFHVLNVGSGIPTSVMQVAEMLRKELGSRSELTVTGNFRVGDIRHCYADLTMAEKVLGFQPKVNVDEGIARFCGWVMTQPVMEDKSAQAMAELAKLGLGNG